MSNKIICWTLLILAGIFFSICLTACAIWTVKEKEKTQAFFKMLATSILFIIMVFTMSYLSTFVKL